MPRPSNRELILDVAETLYAEYGVGRVSLRTIQAAAGLSVGSLRYHFESEEALIEPESGRRYLMLMHRLHTGDYTTPIIFARWPDFAERASNLFRKSLPDLPDSILRFRSDLAWGTILESLAKWKGTSVRDLERQIVFLLDYLAGAMVAVETSPASKSRARPGSEVKKAKPRPRHRSVRRS